MPSFWQIWGNLCCAPLYIEKVLTNVLSWRTPTARTPWDSASSSLLTKGQSYELSTRGGNRRSALYKTCAEKTHSVRGGRMSKGMVSWTSIIFCGLAQGEWTKNMDDKTMHLWGTSVQIVWVLPLESTAFHTSRRCVIVASITAWKNARKEPFRSPYRIGEKV